MEDLKLSVVVATRDRPVQLKQLLSSLSEQTLAKQAFEVIVVDNGSDEYSAKIAKREIASFSHWKYVWEAKAGAAAARNSGVAASVANIIVFLDDDVIADSDLLRQHLAAHANNSSVAVLGMVRFPWSDTESAFFWTLCRHPELFQSFAFPDAENVPFQHFYTCNLSISRSLFLSQGGFDEAFKASGFEDIDFGFRLVQAGHRIIFRPSASALHNVDTDFLRFKKKCYTNGWWLRFFLRKHPGQRDLFLRPGAAQSCSNLIGWLSEPLQALFNGEPRVKAKYCFPILGGFCWHALRRAFWLGYRDAVRSDP